MLTESIAEALELGRDQWLVDHGLPLISLQVLPRRRLVLVREPQALVELLQAAHLDSVGFELLRALLSGAGAADEEIAQAVRG